MKEDSRYHYCVLYTQVIKQWKVYDAIKRALPEGRGTVFYPCAELWWNHTVGTVMKPLFPGYIFIRSDMDRRELHDIIRRRGREITALVRELHFEKEYLSAEDAGEWTDLSDEEAEFLDVLLSFRATDGAEQEKPLKAPEEGVIRMSYGYSEGGRYIVMEGPLKGHEDWIVDVDKYKRKAYLDLRIGGHIAKAGLELRGKRYWFPKDEGASVVLEDGTELDPREIARRMMARK